MGLTWGTLLCWRGWTFLLVKIHEPNLTLVSCDPEISDLDHCPRKNKACILHTHTQKKKRTWANFQRVLTPDISWKRQKQDLNFVNPARLLDGIRQKAKTARIFAARLYRLDLSTNALTSQQTTPELLVPTFSFLETPFLQSLFSNAADKINPTLGLWVLILNSGTLPNFLQLFV